MVIKEHRGFKSIFTDVSESFRKKKNKKEIDRRLFQRHLGLIPPLLGQSLLEIVLVKKIPRKSLQKVFSLICSLTLNNGDKILWPYICIKGYDLQGLSFQTLSLRALTFSFHLLLWFNLHFILHLIVPLCPSTFCYYH